MDFTLISKLGLYARNIGVRTVTVGSSGHDRYYWCVLGCKRNARQSRVWLYL